MGRVYGVPGAVVAVPFDATTPSLMPPERVAVTERGNVYIRTSCSQGLGRVSGVAGAVIVTSQVPQRSRGSQCRRQLIYELSLGNWTYGWCG